MFSEVALSSDGIWRATQFTRPVGTGHFTLSVCSFFYVTKLEFCLEGSSCCSDHAFLLLPKPGCACPDDLLDKSVTVPISERWVPLPSSCALQEFNAGLFDYLVATDDIKLDPKKSQDVCEGGKKRRGGGDAEFGVARGVDFKASLPPSAQTLATSPR